MKIALINGSPKVNGSASDSLLEDLQYYISERAGIVEVELHKTTVPDITAKELGETEVWVFAFPLYVDGIPGHLLSCLAQLEKRQWRNPGIRVYGIVNCGFYEGIQTEPALKVMQNWCMKSELSWCGGIGVGGGSALAQMPSMKNGQGPRGLIEKALEEMADKILLHEIQENKYVSVAIPRLLYKMAGQLGWRQMIRANGGRAKDLGKRPEGSF